MLWLEHYLTTSFRGTLLVVSHDRHFLNAVVTDVAAFDQQQKSLKVYKGDVTNFEAVRADEKLRQKRLWEVQEARRQHMQKFIDDHAPAGVAMPPLALTEFNIATTFSASSNATARLIDSLFLSDLIGEHG